MPSQPSRTIGSLNRVLKFRLSRPFQIARVRGAPFGAKGRAQEAIHGPSPRAAHKFERFLCFAQLCQSKWLEADRAVASRLGMHNPFRYFNSSPEVIRLAVMMYIRYPLSLRQVEDLLFAAEIRKRRIHHRSFSQWRWHLDEVFVRINGETHYLWRAVDHEGEVLDSPRSAGIAGLR